MSDTHEQMTDERIVERIASDRLELERRFAQQKATQESRHKALMASALNGKGGEIKGKKRGRRSVNVDTN